MNTCLYLYQYLVLSFRGKSQKINVIYICYVSRNFCRIFLSPALLASVLISTWRTFQPTWVINITSLNLTLTDRQNYLRNFLFLPVLLLLLLLLIANDSLYRSHFENIRHQVSQLSLKIEDRNDVSFTNAATQFIFKKCNQPYITKNSSLLQIILGSSLGETL